MSSERRVKAYKSIERIEIYEKILDELVDAQEHFDEDSSENELSLKQIEDHIDFYSDLINEQQMNVNHLTHAFFVDTFEKLNTANHALDEAIVLALSKKNALKAQINKENKDLFYIGRKDKHKAMKALFLNLMEVQKELIEFRKQANGIINNENAETEGKLSHLGDIDSFLSSKLEDIHAQIDSIKTQYQITQHDHFFKQLLDTIIRIITLGFQRLHTQTEDTIEDIAETVRIGLNP